MTRRNRPEQSLQIELFKHVAVRRAPGAFVIHIPNGGIRGGKGGRAHFFEIKAEGGRLSAQQRNTHAELTAAGAVVKTANTLDAAIRQLESWGMLRGRAVLTGPPLPGI